MSTMPLPSTSTAATLVGWFGNGLVGNASGVASPKWPSPRPSCTWPVTPGAEPNPTEPPVTVTRSGMPSPLKSAVAWLENVTPVDEMNDGAASRPLPMLGQGSTALPAVPTRSTLPSPLRSAANGEPMLCAYVAPSRRVPPTWPLNTFISLDVWGTVDTTEVTDTGTARSATPSPLKSPTANGPALFAPRDMADAEKLP